MLNAIPAVIPHVKAGRLKALAVTSPERHPLLHAVRTFQEGGRKDFVAFNLLNRDTNKASALRFASVTLDITPGTPGDFLRLLEAEDRREERSSKRS